MKNYSVLTHLEETTKNAQEYWEVLQDSALKKLDLTLSTYEKSILWSSVIYRNHKINPSTLNDLLTSENDQTQNFSVPDSGIFLQQFNAELEEDKECYQFQPSDSLNNKLLKALILIEQTWPLAYQEFKNLIKGVIWFKKENMNRGYSSPRNFGYVFLNGLFFSDKPVQMIATQLIHEAGHHALFVETAIDKLIPKDFGKMIYSPFRGNERPAIGALHALMAMGRMLMWSSHLEKNDNPSDIKESNDLKNDLIPKYKEGITSLLPLEFSERGKALMDSFRNLQDHLI